MSKRSNSNSGKLQATALMCLVVASTIAAASLFVVQILDGENTTPHPQSEQEVMNEEVESPAVTQAATVVVSGDVATAAHYPPSYPAVSNTGMNGSSDFDYCVLVPAVEPNGIPDKLHRGNAIRIPEGLCVSIMAQLLGLYQNDMLDHDDILYDVDPT